MKNILSYTNFRIRYLVVMFILLPVANPAHSTAILDVVAPSEVRVGQTFDVEITIEGVNDADTWALGYWGLHFLWSPSFSTSIANFTFNDFGGDSDATIGFLDPSGFGALPPFVELGQGTQGPDSDQPSSFTLVTVSFTAISPNTATSFMLRDVTLRDEYNLDVPFTFDGGRPSSIYGATIVADISVIPEPGTLILLVLGFALLYSLHFKFRHSGAIDNLKIIGQQGT